MFAVIAKTINSKYFKNIAENTKDLAQNLRLSQLQIHTPKSPRHNFQRINFNENLIKIQKKQQSIINNSHPLNDLLYQHVFNPFENVNRLQDEIGVNNVEQRYKQQGQISIIGVQTMQFEANNPIQDKLVYKKLRSIDGQCMSIFDGHGGNTLSQYASKKITQLIDQYLHIHFNKTSSQPILNINHQSLSFNSQHQLQFNSHYQSQIISQQINIIQNSIQYAYKSIEQSFQQLLQHQLKTGNKEIIKIGTCAITAIIWNHYIIIANSGDSQAIIVTSDQTGLCYFKANQQLNTTNIQEINRIQSQFQGIDDQVLVKSKINSKVYIKGILQPTRTLGDYYLKKQKYFNKVHKATKSVFKGPYIKHNPQFKVIPIKSNFKHLILASDGLWDFASKKDILKVIQGYNVEQSQQMKGFSEQQLSKAYIQKQQYKQGRKLTQLLRDHVLQKCAKKKNRSVKQLLSIPAGSRRDYCDDISIIAVTFGQNHQY